MNIYSPSKLLLLPTLLIAFGIYFYAEKYGTRDDTVWFVVPAIFLAMIYLFGAQIDFWWHEKHPIPLDPRLKKWMNDFLPFYNGFDSATKKLFDHRLGLYIEGREFKSVGSEIRDVPEDIKAAITSIPIMLSLNDKDYLLGDYDRIYLYSHPFPSPRMPFPHTVEIEDEDGLLLFSLEQLLPGILHPHKYFSIGHYAFLEVYFRLKGFHLPLDINWAHVDKTAIYSQKIVEQTSGRTDLNPAIVMGILYFVKPDLIYRNHRAYYEKLDNLFRHTEKVTIVS